MRTSDQYTKAVSQIAPQGSVWPTVSDDSEVGKLWSLIGDTLLSADNAASDVLNDSYPDTVGAFLDDWSRVLGFPRCDIEASSAQQQRDANLAWLNISQYSNKQFFVDIAATLGYTITVEDKNDDPLIPAFQFNVYYPAIGSEISFRTDLSACGEPLFAFASNEPLQCLIEFFAPAHTTPVFIPET